MQCSRVTSRAHALWHASQAHSPRALGEATALAHRLFSGLLNEIGNPRLALRSRGRIPMLSVRLLLKLVETSNVGATDHEILSLPAGLIFEPVRVNVHV